MKQNYLLSFDCKKRGEKDMDDKTRLSSVQQIPNIKKKIGTTTYEVSMHFSTSSKESIEDKIERLIQNDCSNLK